MIKPKPQPHTALVELRNVCGNLGYLKYWIWRHYCDFDWGDPDSPECLCGTSRATYRGVSWEDIKATPCNRCGAHEFEACTETVIGYFSEPINGYDETAYESKDISDVHAERLADALRS